MLDWAVRQYNPLEYPNLSFQEGGFICPNLSDRFDLIVSSCALQHCPNQISAFKNLAGLLKPNGKILILVPALNNAAWKEARKNIQTSVKWASYWQKTPPVKVLTVDEYTQLLGEVGLFSEKVREVFSKDPFVDRREFLDFLLGTLTPVVPREKASEFYDELIDEYVRLLPEVMHSNGVIEARFGRIEIEAIKK